MLEFTFNVQLDISLRFLSEFVLEMNLSNNMEKKHVLKVFLRFCGKQDWKEQTNNPKTLLLSPERKPAKVGEVSLRRSDE